MTTIKKALRTVSVAILGETEKKSGISISVLNAVSKQL